MIGSYYMLLDIPFDSDDKQIMQAYEKKRLSLEKQGNPEIIYFLKDFIGKFHLGRVTNVDTGKAYLEIAPGLTGSISASEFFTDREPACPLFNVIHIGDNIRIKILQLDVDSGVIKLSRREAMAENLTESEWENIRKRQVRSWKLTDFNDAKEILLDPKTREYFDSELIENIKKSLYEQSLLDPLYGKDFAEESVFFGSDENVAQVVEQVMLKNTEYMGGLYILRDLFKKSENPSIITSFARILSSTPSLSKRFSNDSNFKDIRNAVLTELKKIEDGNDKKAVEIAQELDVEDGDAQTTEKDSSMSRFEYQYRETIRRFVKKERNYHSNIEKIRKELSTQESSIRSSHNSKMLTLNETFSSEHSRLETARSREIGALEKRRGIAIAALNEAMKGFLDKAKGVMESVSENRGDAKWALAAAELEGSLSTGKIENKIEMTADEPLYSRIGKMESMSNAVFEEKKKFDKSLKRLAKFRRRRRKFKKFYFSVASIAFLIFIFLGIAVYNQYSLFNSYTEAKTAFDKKQWEKVHLKVEKQQKKLAFRDTAINLLLDLGLYQRMLDAVGHGYVNVNRFQFLMLDREACYRKGVEAFNNRNWANAIKAFNLIWSSEARYLGKYPIQANLHPQAAQKNKEIRLQYIRKKQAYQKKRDLKNYFSDITSLLDDSIYHAGMEAFKWGDWEKARHYFKELPVDEKYTKLIHQCNYNIAIVFFNTRDWNAAYDAFKKCEEFSDCKRKLFEIYVEKKAVLSQGNFGFEKSNRPNTKMVLRTIEFKGLAGETVTIRANLHIQITSGSRTTIMNPGLVWLDSSGKGHVASKWGGVFSGKQRINRFSFRNQNGGFRRGWLEFAGIPIDTIIKDRQFSLHYGKYYNIVFSVRLPNKL